MDDKSDDSVCSSGQREIVYAWALDADSKELPEGSLVLLLDANLS